VLDEPRYRRIGEEARNLGSRNAELAGPHDLALAHRDATADLRQILAERGAGEQPLHLAEPTIGLQPLRPAKHLPQCLDVGREPGEAVQRVLRRIAPTRSRGLGADRCLGELQHPLGGDECAGTGVEVDAGGHDCSNALSVGHGERPRRNVEWGYCTAQ